MENEVLRLELTVKEINTILLSLGKHPFDEIAALIAKIKSQGESQLEEIIQAQQVAAPEAESPSEEAK